MIGMTNQSRILLNAKPVCLRMFCLISLRIGSKYQKIFLICLTMLQALANKRQLLPPFLMKAVR